MIEPTEVRGEARDSVGYDLQKSKHPSLVSFILVAYNQEDFIEEAIISAINQNYEPLEIIISDDASTDQTFKIAKAAIDRYKGPHHVIGWRQPGHAHRKVSAIQRKQCHQHDEIYVQQRIHFLGKQRVFV